MHLGVWQCYYEASTATMQKGGATLWGCTVGPTAWNIMSTTNQPSFCRGWSALV